MLELLAVILLDLCVVLGMLLRYAPFASILTTTQKQTLAAAHTAANIINLLVLAVVLRFWWMEGAFAYLRFGSILYAAVTTAIQIFVIQGRTREHLFVFGIVITFHYLLLYIPNYVVSFLSTDSATVSIFTILGVYCALLVLTYWPIRKLVCNTVEPFLCLDSGEYWNTNCFTPIIFFASRFLYLGGEHNTGSIRQFISSILCIAIMILICKGIIADQERLCKNQTLEKQLVNQKIHYTELKVRVEEARKTKHDFKYHLTAIRRYIDLDDKDGLRGYCDELMGHTDGQNTIPYTGNAAADGVLYHYIQRAQQEQIQFQYSGTIHSRGIADVDLCVLLGNALDNAFTACLTIPQDRSIALVSQSDQQLLSIVIRNTFDGKVKQSEEGLLSRKRENSCGVGLLSMRSICERYGGSLDTQWDEHTFFVTIILPLTDSQ